MCKLHAFPVSSISAARTTNVIQYLASPAEHVLVTVVCVLWLHFAVLVFGAKMHDKSLLLLCVSVKIELESYVFQNSNLLPRRIWILQVPPMYYVLNPMTLLHATPASYSLYFTYHFSSISMIQPRHILVRCSSGIYDNTLGRSVNCAVNSLDYRFIVPTHFPGSGMRLGLSSGITFQHGTSKNFSLSLAGR